VHVLTFHFPQNPYNTVFDAKRLIGRKFDDAEVQSDMKHWPFTVLNKATKPVIQVEYKGEKKEFVSSVLRQSLFTRLTLFPDP
jgi:heat shock protein 1/8